MTQSAREQAKKWLEGWDPRTQFTGEERDKILALVGNQGFGLLLAFMGAERQGLYNTLAQLDLSDSAQNRLGSVIQGKIMALDMVRQSVLDLYPDETVPTTEGEPSYG